ncbi:hypothetical protein CYMTET_33573 [Cymbomonas tetramitiformis]|uniref:Major facilitator superfamily (MFS) profile domain-containing protein n=1 Tax=Cymbomonas tetramitiformis TaxID=36881 RepID=A0AAE0FCX0_9CHLO|nr:hypothetical protein CYMTET_33573 [Cymbomonas tetramitiformis]
MLTSWQIVRHNWGLILGNTLEWYDFSVYGYLEPQIASNFFEDSSVAAWLGFAVTFAARPLGGVILGRLADKYGRRTSLLLSIYGMVIATVFQGCLPSASTGSTVGSRLGLPLLVILRFVQGIFCGGEIGSLSVYLAEWAPSRRLGLASATISLGGSLAFFVASSLCAALSHFLTADQMNEWGWRVPFLLALFPGLVSARLRSTLIECTAESDDTQLLVNSNVETLTAVQSSTADIVLSQDEVATGLELQAAPISKVHGVMYGIGGTAAVSALWYVGPLYAVSWSTARGSDHTLALVASSGAQLMSLLLALPVGHLTDTVGVGAVTLLGAISVTISGLPVYLLIENFAEQSWVYIMSVGMIWGVAQAIAGSTIYLFNCELFPRSIRATGVGISYNTAVCYIGGLGPVMVDALSSHISTKIPIPGCYISAVGAISVALLASAMYQHTEGKSNLAHIRPDLYCSLPKAWTGSWMKEITDCQDDVT